VAKDTKAKDGEATVPMPHEGEASGVEFW